VNAFIAILLPLLQSGAPSPAPGFSAADLPDPAIGPDYLVQTLTDGRFVAVLGGSIRLYEENGAQAMVLHTFPNTFEALGEAIAIDESETFVVAANTWNTSRVPLSGGPGQNYLPAADGIVVESSSSALIWVVGGEFNSWDLYRLHFASGAAVHLGEADYVQPVCLDLDGDGNLFIGHSLPGEDQYVVERFAPAQFQAANSLALGEGVIVHQADGEAEDVDVTPDGERIYIAEEPPGLFTSGRILDLATGSALLPVEILVTDPGERLQDIQWFAGTPPAVFLAYQPPTGGELVFQTSYYDFGYHYPRRSLLSARPTAVLSGPGTTGVGPVDLTIAGAPPQGSAVVFRGPLSLYDPNEVAYQPSGIPIFFGLDPESALQVPVVIQLDPSGGALQTFNNASGSTGIWAIQAAVFDREGDLVGTTTAAFL
jgi:hypothetical protein